MPEARPTRPPLRTYALALTPYVLVGVGVFGLLAGLGADPASASGAASLAAGAMTWLDLRSRP